MSFSVVHSFLSIIRGIVLIALSAVSLPYAYAETLSFRFYTSSDGLVHDVVNEIVSDSRGFLWFCTEDGLSRFDGQVFKNYTQAHGLPHRNVNDLLETREGEYLLATSGGLTVFDPNGRPYAWNVLEGKLEQNSNEPPLFRTYYPDDLSGNSAWKAVVSLLQDRRGNLYAAAFKNLYRLLRTDGEWRFERVVFGEWEAKGTEFNDLLEDGSGAIWIATNTGIYRMLTDGSISLVNSIGANTLFQARDGKLWMDSGGNSVGIRVYGFRDVDNTPVLESNFTKKDGLPTDMFTNAVAQTADGQLYIRSNGQLLKFLPDAANGEAKFRSLNIDGLNSVSLYREQLWFGFFGKGVAKVTNENFLNFGQTEGLPERISSLFAGPNGEIYFTAGQDSFQINEDKVERVKPRDLGNRTWGYRYLDIVSNNGDFWIPSETGLLRYQNAKNLKDLERIVPSRFSLKQKERYEQGVFSTFQDSKGQIWFGTFAENSLSRLNVETKVIEVFNDPILPKNSPALSYGEDDSGNLWICFHNGEIFRYKNGEFRGLTKEGFFPQMSVSSFTSDSKGRLWLATLNRGVFRVDEPDNDSLVYTNLSTAEGLPSNQTLITVEDDFGRIYIGTARGIARLEPGSGALRIYTKSDGFPSNSALYGLKDKKGDLWFSSFSTITRFSPRVDVEVAPPTVFIDAFSAGGNTLDVSDLGESMIKGLEFAPDDRQIQISFFAISFGSGENLRFQYKLNENEWSSPSDQRGVSLDLAPGSYDFAVRAINADGVVSENNSRARFVILRPVWQRWWFITLAIVLVGGSVLALDRYRIAKTREAKAALAELKKSREERFAELQRVRSRIAADLHDDIGSSLTQIAVLSEIAKSQADISNDEKLIAPLVRIKGVSKELVDVMSDVVWAINPSKDNLRDLVQRMRRFASDTCSGKNIHFDLEAPSLEDIVPLGANIRREVFAIFKESINNSVKYSNCKKVDSVFRIDKSVLILEIHDDGDGFDSELVDSAEFSFDRGGNGLINMRRRATELGGRFRIDSKIGEGTRILLEVPIDRVENAEIQPTQ